MTDSVVALMEENLLAVFNERDPQRRLEVIRRNYAPDVRWADGEETVTGQDRLHEKAQELLDGQLAGPWNAFAPAPAAGLARCDGVGDLLNTPEEGELVDQ
mgnify:CR=1 FL=1